MQIYAPDNNWVPSIEHSSRPGVLHTRGHASRGPLYHGRHLINALFDPLSNCPTVESTHLSKSLAGRRPCCCSIVQTARRQRGSVGFLFLRICLGLKKTVCAKTCQDRLLHLRRYNKPLSISDNWRQRRENNARGVLTRQACPKNFAAPQKQSSGQRCCRGTVVSSRVVH